jgi:hypothetical protein
MAGWVVSMHGAYSSYASVAAGRDKVGGEPSHVKIPTGRTIYFYVKENVALYGGWDIFYELMDPAKIEKARSAAIERVKEGQLCRNYYMMPEPSWTDSKGSASGVFLAGDRDGDQGWILDKPGDMLSLHQLLQSTSPGDDIFWVSCRVCT